MEKEAFTRAILGMTTKLYRLARGRKELKAILNEEAFEA